MPTYYYRVKKTGELIERIWPIAEMIERQKHDSDGEPYIRTKDGRAYRDIKAEAGDFVNTPGNYPMCCESSGVNPSQIKEVEAHLRERGVPTHFTKDGRAIYESATHRRKALEARGFYDRNGGYSDPQRR